MKLSQEDDCDKMMEYRFVNFKMGKPKLIES